MTMTNWLFAGSFLLFQSASGVCAGLPGQPKVAGPGSQRLLTANTVGTVHSRVYTVKPGRLTSSVVERGVVEAIWTARTCSRLKRCATVSWILPEGTFVFKGQPVCQLEAEAESCMIFAPANGVVVHAIIPHSGAL